jgi:hypothetical protein
MGDNTITFGIVFYSWVGGGITSSSFIMSIYLYGLFGRGLAARAASAYYL